MCGSRPEAGKPKESSMCMKNHIMYKNFKKEKLKLFHHKSSLENVIRKKSIKYMIMELHVDTE